MKSLRDTGRITEEEFNQFWHHYGVICEHDLKLNAIPKAEFEELLKKHFKIKAIMYGEDFDKHSNHPIYVLEK